MPKLVCFLLGLILATPARAMPVESEVCEQWALLRADPAAFAHHLEAWLPLFAGNVLQLPSGPLLTQEGPAAVREAIAVLKATKPLPRLQLSAGIALAARDHVRDLGPRGGLGHIGADGSTPGKRLSRHGEWTGEMSESITFGAPSALDVMLELLVDDNTPSRGHREMLLYGQSALVGVACGPHQTYQAMCVLDLASQFVAADQLRPAAPLPVAVTALDDSKPYGKPIARVPKDGPTALDLAIFAEINALRTDPPAWAARLEMLLPLFKSQVLHRPGRTAVYWPGAPGSFVATIAALKATKPLPPAQWVASMAAGARDYVRVRAVREPVFREGYHSAYDAARRYGAGPLRGNMNMRGDGDAFDIVLVWVVRGEGLNATLLGSDVGQIGVACTPACSHPLMCSLLYGTEFQDFNAPDLAVVEAATQRLSAARSDPRGEAKRLREMLSGAKADSNLPGGTLGLQKLIARLERATGRGETVPSAELQARARELAQAVASGRTPAEAARQSSRAPTSFGQAGTAATPNELTILAPRDGDQLALRALVEQPEWLLGVEPIGIGLWCAPHATQGRACVVDIATDWVAAGPEMP